MQAAQRHIELLNEYVRDFENISTSLLYALFYSAIDNKSNSNERIEWQKVAEAFASLQSREDVNYEQMVDLEMKYLDFFCQSFSHAKPVFIYKKFKSSPEFFVQVVRKIVEVRRIENFDNINPDELSILFRSASNYRWIIDHWNDIPGKKENGKIDGRVLNKWVAR